jgi:hypothetical protein
MNIVLSTARMYMWENLLLMKMWNYDDASYHQNGTKFRISIVEQKKVGYHLQCKTKVKAGAHKKGFNRSSQARESMGDTELTSKGIRPLPFPCLVLLKLRSWRGKRKGRGRMPTPPGPPPIGIAETMRSLISDSESDSDDPNKMPPDEPATNVTDSSSPSSPMYSPTSD